jgi:hypothetical protein
MFRPGIARDLSLLTAAKLLILLAIYFALFAPFNNQPDDTAAHLLGAAHHPGTGGS